MLFKDFFFSFKNVHISFIEKKKISKFIRVGISILYKFFVLELIIIQSVGINFFVDILEWSDGFLNNIILNKF